MNVNLFSVIKAILARLMFIAVSFLCVHSLVQVEENVLYWFMLGTVILTCFEATVTLTTREGGEWKWFYPSFLIALMSTVPSIWILELNIMEEHIKAAEKLGLDKCTDETLHNNSLVDKVADSLGLTPEEWSLFLQQILLFTLILGRWMLPKGSMTRDQLSQLLLVFIGIAADILEFSTESLKLSIVRCNEVMIVTILSLWTWSLMQFTLGLTVTKSRKIRVAGVNDRRENVNQVCAGGGCGCCETETWGIMVTIIMQDGPFFIMRMFLMFHEDIINQGMIFFTCKNFMVLLLQFYRLLVLYCEKPHSGASNIFLSISQRTRILLAIKNSRKDVSKNDEKCISSEIQQISSEDQLSNSRMPFVVTDIETNEASSATTRNNVDSNVTINCFHNPTIESEAI